MREILPKIAVKGTENRYLAICDVLNIAYKKKFFHIRFLYTMMRKKMQRI